MNNTIKHIRCITLGFMMLISHVSAQDQPTSIKELGVAFQNLKSFGMVFKTGSERSLFRLNTIAGSSSYSSNFQDYFLDNKFQSQEQIKTFSFGVDLRAGWEFRKTVLKNFEIRYGADFLLFNNFSKRVNEPNLITLSQPYQFINLNYIIAPGFGLIAGINYVIKKQLVLGIEVLPSLSYEIFREESKSVNTLTEQEKISSKNTKTTWNYNISNSWLLFTVSYRFGKAFKTD